MSERPMLVVMRLASMYKVHPRTDFSHNCERCKKAVGIYPSGQQAMRDHPGIEIVCHVCAEQDRGAIILAEPLPGVEQERRESVDAKIAVGTDGSYLEPDPEPRNSPWHKRILRVEKMPNTKTGNYLTLECGHGVTAFGKLEYADGVVLCTKCRDLEQT